MQIDSKTIQGIAHLARLEFDKESESSMLQDFNKILTWMEKLNEIDTSQVEPLIHMSDEVNKLREDEAKITLSHEEALYNAPKKDSDYFRVPKFLG
jgi:aspartyl-tRNA(Asn)/glutamyl-tRNA(Gln) amidotransferase subunit C